MPRFQFSNHLRPLQSCAFYSEESSARRPRTASKPVKLQRPGEGRRVQSLLDEPRTRSPALISKFTVAIVETRRKTKKSVKLPRFQGGVPEEPSPRPLHAAGTSRLLWDFRTFLAGLRKTYGDRLLAALHHPAPPPLSRPKSTVLLPPHRAGDTLRCSLAVFATTGLFSRGHGVFLPNVKLG